MNLFLVGQGRGVTLVSRLLLHVLYHLRRAAVSLRIATIQAIEKLLSDLLDLLVFLSGRHEGVVL